MSFEKEPIELSSDHGLFSLSNKEKILALLFAQAQSGPVN